MGSVQHPSAGTTDDSVNVSTETDWSPEATERAKAHFYEHGAAMCFAPTAALTDQRLDDATVRTLLAMSAFATPDGVLVVSQADLARRMGVGTSGMSKRFAKLEAAGYLERVGRTWRICFLAGRNPTVPPGRNVSSQDATFPEPRAHAINPPGLTSTTESITVSRTSKVHLPLTDEERQKIHQRYDSQFPSPEAVDELIDTALNHKAVDKAKGEYLYALGWVRREASSYREHVARMATEKARLERAKTPYAGRTVVEEPALKLTPLDPSKLSGDRTRLAS